MLIEEWIVLGYLGKFISYSYIYADRDKKINVYSSKNREKL